jgi:hypothetical protein
MQPASALAQVNPPEIPFYTWADGSRHASPERTSISLSDLEDALAGLDIYKPGLSYAETAEVIINYRKDHHA